MKLLQRKFLWPHYIIICIHAIYIRIYNNIPNTYSSLNIFIWNYSTMLIQKFPTQHVKYWFPWLPSRTFHRMLVTPFLPHQRSILGGSYCNLLFSFFIRFRKFLNYLRSTIWIKKSKRLFLRGEGGSADR